MTAESCESISVKPEVYTSGTGEPTRMAARRPVEGGGVVEREGESDGLG
jgi:hypothetical protein